MSILVQIREYFYGFVTFLGFLERENVRIVYLVPTLFFVVALFLYSMEKSFLFFQQFREFGKSDSTNCNCTIQSYNHHHHHRRRQRRRRHCSRHHTRTIFKIAFGSIMVWFSLVLVLLSLFLEIRPPPPSSTKVSTTLGIGSKLAPWISCLLLRLNVSHDEQWWTFEKTIYDIRVTGAEEFFF